jgi:hypothetical protein
LAFGRSSVTGVLHYLGLARVCRDRGDKAMGSRKPSNWANGFARFAPLAGLLLTAPVAQAAELNGLNIEYDLNSLQPSYLSATDNFESNDPSPIADYFANWNNRVDQARATQPHWETPLATSTPRLTQEVVGNILLERLGNGADLNNFGGGKGLDLIPTTTNQISFYTPPYEVRTGPDAAHGIGDWPFFLIKQRLVSANEENGDYIVTAFVSGQAPIGDKPFTNNAYVITPTLAGGKGWGRFNIQASFAMPVPVELESHIGTLLASNVTFQYHLWKYLWPEFELNDTYWFDGERGGKDQLFLTSGIVIGPYPVSKRVKLNFGVGYQVAVLPTKLTLEPLTPMFDHSVLFTARVDF